MSINETTIKQFIKIISHKNCPSELSLFESCRTNGNFIDYECEECWEDAILSKVGEIDG